ncbi:hypothetical protein ACRDU6_10090 [Mycolicibacterium sp. ELW1]|uniref:hypothetical protein n=1 Tax=Mycobacteriaceae TaxID=1762 RepID=UPI0011EBADD7|nr:hypothetical protein [Mycobacterium sp. ELW1]QEN12972.1 hypothetical protein D3H54_06645 [Mycobacterium sp. ELW1]
MHRHPLQRRAIAVCHCCRLEQVFIFSSASDPVICKSCRRHAQHTDGETGDLRSADHASLYFSEIGVLQEDLAAAKTQQSESSQREIDATRPRLSGNAE